MGEYSAFEHLCLSIGMAAPGNLFGMFTCYFDESGGADHGFITVCGWVASVERWQRFDVEWKSMLAAYDVPYFHLKELAHFRGPYSKWRGPRVEERDAFFKESSRIICETVEHGFLCAVYYEHFRKVNERFQLKEHQRSPYALAGRFCIAGANAWMEAQGRSLREIDYVFEDGGPDVGGLAELAKRSKLKIPKFGPSRESADQAAMIQLQAADYFAYEIRKAIVDHPDKFTKPEEFRKSFQALFGCDVDQGNYGEQELLNLCEGAQIPHRDI
jgi:hypothetical protein